jgi:hypothetical protein
MVLAPPTQKTRQNVMEVERKLVLVATSLSHSILPLHSPSIIKDAKHQSSSKISSKTTAALRSYLSIITKRTLGFRSYIRVAKSISLESLFTGLRTRLDEKLPGYRISATIAV